MSRPTHRTTLRRVLLALVLASVASTAAPATAAAHGFHVTCGSSHVLRDDPIVFPRQPGASHRHEFFGATTAAAGSTLRTLVHSPTTCGHPRDTAAYWTPSLEVRGVRVRGTMTAYYSRAGKRRAAAPPRNLKVVAGSARATTPQAMAATHWQCVGRGRATRFRALPACRRGERLAAWVLFPDCWDGRSTDSADHRSHLAYARRGSCPGSHPVGIMRLAVRVVYPARPQRAAIVTLGGGALSTAAMHADFWNAWHQPTLAQLRWDCIEVARACGDVGTRRPTRRPSRG